MLVFWHLLVDEHHVGGDGVGLVLDPLPHGLHVGGDGLSLVCLQLGLGLGLVFNAKLLTIYFIQSINIRIPGP